eukprot:GGOE01013939.1.p2 GENE.GGOE01013939.1~~GGOE01013939.1.p2  ORF type:complete len:328 (-),score=126.25 GGOE01013939.1:180-1163(-)
MINELTRPNFAKFKLRLDSSLPDDLHRSFIGYYFPDTRSIALFEVRKVLQTVKFLPLFREATHLKPDGSTYLLDDIEEGATLVLGRLQNDRDQGAVKPFVITEVDDSHITAINLPGVGESAKAPATFGLTARSDLEALWRKYSSRFSPSVVKALGVAFTVKDAGGQRTATTRGLLDACQALDVGCTKEEVEEIVRALDTNGDGALSHEEFMFICRGNMSEARRQCVRKAFQKVDYNRKGVITTEEMKLFYNPMYDQRLSTGERTTEELVAEFVAQFDSNGNGLITFQEFEDYYNGVSASFRSDQEFVGMMQRFWNLDHRNAAGVSFH